MNKSFSKILFLTFIIIGFSSVTVMANKYTAKPRKPTTSAPQNYGEGEKCSPADIKAIKKFDVKATRKVNQYLKFLSKTDDRLTEEPSDKLEKFRKYFYSDKYTAMKDIYKKCGKEIPWPMQPAPFWMPEDKEVPLGVM